MSRMRVLGAAGLCVAAAIGVGAQARVPDTPDGLVTAAKRAAGVD